MYFLSSEPSGNLLQLSEIFCVSHLLLKILMNTHQNKVGIKTEMNMPVNINIKELKIYLNCIQSFKSYPCIGIKRKSPWSVATNDPMPLAVTSIKGWWFIGSSSFQTPQVHTPVDNITEIKEWVKNYALFFQKKCNIEDSISKIKENMDRPKITLKSAVIRNHFGNKFFLIFIVFLKWLLKLVLGQKIIQAES